MLLIELYIVNHAAQWNAVQHDAKQCSASIILCIHTNLRPGFFSQLNGNYCGSLKMTGVKELKKLNINTATWDYNY